MKILITGAGGWLGSELTEQLLKKGEVVKALVLNASPKLKKLKEIYNNNLEIIEGNMCSKEIVESALNNVDKVFHLAAKVHCQPKNKKDIEDFFKINTEASKILFDKCVEKKIKRVIFYSSVSVYGESEKIININSAKNANTPYAKSKLEAEEYGLKLNKEKGLPITIIQPVTVYGGDDVGNFEKMRAFSEKGFLPIFGDGENKKTIIYFKDLIEMTIEIGNKEKYLNKRVICGSEIISLNEISKILANINQNKCRIIKINKNISSLLEKICSIKAIGSLNSIARQIKVLKMNNEYDIEEAKKIVKNNITFKEYYTGEVK